MLSSIVECIFVKIENEDMLIELYYDNLLCLNNILNENVYLISSIYKPMIKYSISVYI